MLGQSVCHLMGKLNSRNQIELTKNMSVASTTHNVIMIINVVFPKLKMHSKI